MKVIQIKESPYRKTYATEANLTKGTAALDLSLTASMENMNVRASSVRKMIFRMPDAAARWTALYVLDNTSTFLATQICLAGFHVTN